jgi:hypothetical protein
VRARLERHKDIGVTGGLARLGECEHLGVRLTGGRMVALPHNPALAYDHTPYKWVGSGVAPAALSKRERAGQVRVVDPRTDVIEQTHATFLLPSGL